MNKLFRKVIEIFQIKDCRFCGRRAVVVCTTYSDKRQYLCSECLRGFRFREKEFWKSILPYGKNE